jgi:hypothetical protein
MEYFQGENIERLRIWKLSQEPNNIDWTFMAG